MVLGTFDLWTWEVRKRGSREGVEECINSVISRFTPAVYLSTPTHERAPWLWPLYQTVGSTCGLASLVSFTLNGDEVGQLLIELNMSPSCGPEMSLINILLFLFCPLDCSENHPE